ncbi:hypothetical protein ACFODL_11930 [Phenylobacterium terrae]|uniref:Uncharacterized protein n=1 Tax=Phenylobacterium terrae TaxID=2665495 RepID=A0ABW4N011_9CAUL
MNSSNLAMGAACAVAVLCAAAAASAQDVSSLQDVARTTEMAAKSGIDMTVADAFTPGPAEPPAPRAVPPASRPTWRNPWTTPRPSLRAAFSQMAAAFRSEFRQTLPPAHGLAAAEEEPEPVFEAAHDIDFTVADAFDPRRLGAPAASSQGVQASALVGERDDGVARARALNLENAKKAAGALEAYEAAQRDYEKELARWREQLTDCGADACAK